MRPNAAIVTLLCAFCSMFALGCDRRQTSGTSPVPSPTRHLASGANQIGHLQVHPGTYGIRQSTLRSLVADVGGELAQNRFKWVFVLSGHGAPTHHSAIGEACDFVSDAFKTTMVSVSGLFNADAAIQAKGASIATKYFSPAEVAAFGRDVHAGVSETSGMLAVRPDLVRPNFRSLPDVRADSLKESRDAATKPGWQGYFSSPAKANAAYGRDIEAWWVEGMTDLVLQAVRGEDLSTRPRWPAPIQDDPSYPQVVEGILGHERQFELELERWLARRKAR